MTARNQFALLKSRRFLPLFIAQFLGAFHDNLFKNALVVLLLYGAAGGVNPKILTTLAMGVFITPYVLFSAMGGQLADYYSKEKVMRIVKLAEIGIAALGAAALLSGSVAMCFLTLFALGTHSAFFAPAKYSILPQHLEDDELIGGNAILNTGTFLAVLAGTVAGTSLIDIHGGKIIVSALLFLCAACGWLASRSIPPAPSAVKERGLAFNPFAATLNAARDAFARPGDVKKSILGISWFYFMGGMFMTQIPNFTRDILRADEHVLSLLLVSFSFGIAAGGLLNNRLLKGRIEATLVPAAILGITIFTLDLCAAAVPAGGGMVHLPVFLSAPSSWRVVFDVAAISLCGGLFVIPLNAIVQHRAPENQRARVQAGNAIVNAVFVAASSALSAGLMLAGLSVTDLFRIFAVANAFAAFYVCDLLPESALKRAMPWRKVK
jgi:acyl-[acyl-carrier-protein]-phospholipid O-acyltransferase/long-chain-fatty-acid--[acyl-carrier-protein] ligase